MELVDVYDEDTQLKTGEVISKDEAHEKGIWHSAIHLIIIDKNNSKVLLQKRCKEKKLYPGMWDITVGGHISSGEEAIDALARELKEELGLNIEDYDVNYMGMTKEELLNNGINSKEVVFIYLVKEDIDINNIVLQVEEVSEVAWFNKKEFEELVQSKKIIEHVKEFEIIRNILQ